MLARSFRQAVVAVAVLLGSLPATAQYLFGTIEAGGGASTLVEINIATGALVRTIGNVGYAVNGMTWDAATSTLYATTSTRDPTFPNGLIRINPLTGAGTPVGAGTGQLVNVPAANSTGGLFGWTEDSDQPVQWNKAAGTITVLGGGVGSAQQSLAFDNANVLYFLNSGAALYTINTTTGVATFVGNVAGVATAIAHHGDFHPVTNLMYAIDRTGSGNNPRNLYVINAGTLAVTATLPTVDDLHTLAFLPAGALAAAQVPVNNPIALLALTVLLLVAGSVYLRRRQA
jgi:hypothetical protein